MTEKEEMYLGDISVAGLEILGKLKEEFTVAMKCFLSDVSSVSSVSSVPENLKCDKFAKEIEINAIFNLLFIKMVTELNEHLTEKAMKGDAAFKQILNVYKCLIRAANDLFDERNKDRK